MTLPPPISVPLPPLPAQDPNTPWPTPVWPSGPVPSGVDLEGLLDEVFDEDGPCRTTNAVVVIHKGRLIAERYAGVREFFDRDPEPVDASTPLISWSMAKSMLQSLLFTYIDEGAFSLEQPLDIPEWNTSGDPRATITLGELLAMRDGLSFSEEYDDTKPSDAIAMLFGEGRTDMAHYAASRPLLHAPGTTYSYSSGTTNIISGALRRHLGGEVAYRAALRDRLFGPLHMESALPGFDEAGTFIGSSYVHATAQDFARFGLCLLRGGVMDDQQVLSATGIHEARTPRSLDPDGLYYSSQFWVRGDDYGTFAAQGFEGQSISMSPALDLVLVRLGRTDAERFMELRNWRFKVIDAFGAAQ